MNIAEHFTGIHEGMNSDFRTDKVLLNVTSLNLWKLPKITKMAFGASIKGRFVHWWCTKLIIFKINEVRFHSESSTVNGIVTRRWRVRVEVHVSPSVIQFPITYVERSIIILGSVN